jgi:FkbM family methyltransferase
MPTQFTEPFGGSGVEAMLCGTPLVAVDYGAFTETIADGVTGFRCHTLEEWMDAIENCGNLDRQVVSEVARHKYSLDACAAKYDRVFSTLGNLYREGWYTCDKYPIKLSRFDRVLTELEGKDCFFVSVGAMDGVNHDSLFQYTNRNKHWRGMLVEPVREYFEKLKANYDYRENLFFENVAVLPESGEKLIHRIPSDLIKDGKVPTWADGISTFHPESGAMHSSRLLEKSVKEQVNGVTFRELAVKNNICSIDVLQIDTEGCDLNVFQQIWEMGYRPKLIRIEVVHMSSEEYETFVELIGEDYDFERNGDDLIAERRQNSSLVELQVVEEVSTAVVVPVTDAKTLKVAFFTYDEWAFGSIHNALCKELLQFGIQANLLDWNKHYSSENFQSFLDIYDVFVTTPGNAVSALQNVYGVPSDRIIAVAHEVYDLEFGLAEGNDFDSFKGFAVINPNLAQVSEKLGIKRVPNVVRNGIHFDYFYQKTPSSLSTIGYAGSMESFTFGGTTERKRGRLVAEVAASAGLLFKPATGYSHFAMPSYYKSVDCVLMSSTQEACGLPMLEAAAAGRLPMGTRVGYLAEHGKGGIWLPMCEKEYVKVASALVTSLNRYPELFKQNCEEVQEYARYNYDWKYVITDWVSLLNNP